MKHVTIRTAMKGLVLTLAMWAVLLGLAEWHGASWPHRQVNVATCFNRTTLEIDYAKCRYFSRSYQWSNFLLIGFIVEFLLLKAWMMAAMTKRWDRLGTSLIAANVMFAVLYLYALSISVFPSWSTTRTPLDVIRLGLVVVLIWGIVQLLLVPDQEPWDGESERRAPTDRRAGWGKQTP